MRKIKINRAILVTTVVTAAVTALIITVGFCLWFNHVYTVERTIVHLSSLYQAEVLGKPDILARVYSLGARGEGYGDVLVLTSKSSEHPEGYIVNVNGRKIGLPSFPDYIPFLNKFAMVDKWVYDGYPYYGELKADWDVKDDGKEVHIRIKGFKDEELGGTEESAKKCMPLAYESEIILTRLFDPRRGRLDRGKSIK